MRSSMDAVVRRCLHSSVVCARGRWPFYNPHKAVTDPSRQDPDYFEKKAETLSIDKNYLENLSRLYYEKAASNRDLIFKREDNLVQHDSKCWLPDIDTSQPRLAYRKVEALKRLADFFSALVVILMDSGGYLLLGRVA
uniref:Uncharacterized protein n=1 Tax=Plectus sambesii TaxID=2011161 RepID=A0A914V341_9BILA